MTCGTIPLPAPVPLVPWLCEGRQAQDSVAEVGEGVHEVFLQKHIYF